MKLNFTNIIKHHLTAAIGGFLTFTLIFQVAFTSAASAANAATLNSSTILAASISSMAKQVEGKAEQALGNAEKSIGKVAAEIQGNGKEIAGRAKEDLGKVQSAGDDAKYGMRKGMNKAQSKAKQVGAKAEETNSNAIDAVKGFFGK
jgi:uncharacterized protein YjbJ (UPF0337 family)